MSFEGGELECTVAYEQLAATGEVTRRNVYKSTRLLLGRNEFKEVILKVTLGKRDFSYRLQDITVHKKFAREGKATIKLLSQKLQLLLSNCPPDRLLLFLKTMSTKLECLRQKGFVSDRKRLHSDLQRTFQEISPLNMQELENVHNMRAKALESRGDIFTPKGKRKAFPGRKRPREGCDGKENMPPKVYSPKKLKMLDRSLEIITQTIIVTYVQYSAGKYNIIMTNLVHY